jgi:hypothetical protein
MGYVAGPWWVEIAEGGGDGCEVHDGYGHTATVWGEPDVALANARLIAAAPELLAALREVADGCEYRLRKGMDSGDEATLRLCRAAIDKAEGRSA